MDVSIWGGFVIGFLGSFHCVGMCGPIALALPIGKSSNFQLVVSRILYNLGRVVTYTFLVPYSDYLGKGLPLRGFNVMLLSLWEFQYLVTI